MNKVLLGGVALLALCAADRAQAADIQIPGLLLTNPTSVWSWSGAYIGAHMGAGTGHSTFADPYGTSIYGDAVRTPAFLLGGQAGYNWQSPGSSLVWGIEGDLTWIDGEGSNTCFATTADVPGFGTGMITSSTCRAQPSFTGTLTGRLGMATGIAGHTLLYMKGGLAVQRNRLDATTNWGFGVFPTAMTSTSATNWGWTIGAGIEQAIAPAWSVKLEYDYLWFGNATLATPATFTTTPGGVFTAVPSMSTSVRQDFHQVKVGLNYKIGEEPFAKWSPADGVTPVSGAPQLDSGWGFEPGIRYWYSSGRFQKDLPASSGSSTNLISRLTYDKMTGSSGEVFARLNMPMNLFVKGFIGMGRTFDGTMNDEDWGLFALTPTAYSNTRSGLSNTGINYATIDAGFDILHPQGYKVGIFVGYNHIYEQYNAADCTQIAAPLSGICSPPISSTSVITETDKWDSWRVGLSTMSWLTEQLKLTTDIAYLPYVKFTGVDNHWLRSLVIDESGTGRGVQLEAMLSYYVLPQLSVGIGGRYWVMWTHSGNDAFNGVPIDRNDTYRYERYGVLAQMAYKFF